MEVNFLYQGHIDQDLEELSSSRGSQTNCSLFSEEEKNESTMIKFYATEGETISNQEPEGEINTMVVLKWSDAVEIPRAKSDGPFC